MAKDERSPYDGVPFYCAKCGAGFGEFLACELPDCKLESDAAALARQQKKTRPRKVSKLRLTRAKHSA